MQFESDFWFDMDDGFGLSTPSPSPVTIQPSASVAFNPFCSSGLSRPNELKFDDLARKEPTELFNEGIMAAPTSYIDNHVIEMNITSAHSIGSIIPSNILLSYTTSPKTTMGTTSYKMPPKHTLSHSEITKSSASGSCSYESAIPVSPQKSPGSLQLESPSSNRPLQSLLDISHLHGPHSPFCPRAHHKIKARKTERKTTQLQCTRTQASGNVSDGKPGDAADIVHRAMCKCDYPGCHKVFRRAEHLKRHKKSFHTEEPKRLACEFCGKSQFNRQDNLNTHRKLHARPGDSRRRVEFIRAAVPILEQEENARKRRRQPKSRQLDMGTTITDSRISLR